MAFPAGIHHFSPGEASLQIRTYREGVAAKAGHDLILTVARWDATLEVGGEPGRWTVSVNADPRSLEVRAGVGGVKPLTDRDRAEIRKNIDAKVLGASRSGSAPATRGSSMSTPTSSWRGSTRWRASPGR